MAERVYQFDWSMIGDIDRGRPTLGHSMSVEVYRLFQFCVRDLLEERVGADVCDRLFQQAGYLAGQQFCKNVLQNSLELGEFLENIRESLEKFGIGLLEVENLGQGEDGKPLMHLVVREDLDCSGLPVMGRTTCAYDEGFIAGMLRGYTGGEFEVEEINCWCKGDDCCRFAAKLK